MSSSLSVRIRGLGPFYVATERKSREPHHFSRAWITEMAPPYRKGKGVRVRLGHRAFQVGVCRRSPDVTEETLIEHVGWRRMDDTVEDIRSW